MGVRGRRGDGPLRGALRHDLAVHPHHRRGIAGQHHAGEDLHHQQRHAQRAQHLHLQPGGGRPAAAGHLRARGRLPILLRGVGVRGGSVQAHPRHPADICRRVGVHAHGAQRGQVRRTPEADRKNDICQGWSARHIQLHLLGIKHCGSMRTTLIV